MNIIRLRFAWGLMAIILTGGCAHVRSAPPQATDPIVGEWSGEGPMMMIKARFEANGTWGLPMDPTERLTQHWERKGDRYFLQGVKGSGVSYTATIAQDGALLLEPQEDPAGLSPNERETYDAMSPQERKEALEGLSMRMRKKGELLGSLANQKQARAALTPADVAGNWQWVWSRTSMFPTPPNFHEMLLTASGDVQVTNSLVRQGIGGHYRLEQGQLKMTPAGGVQAPPNNIGFEGELLVLGSGDGVNSFPVEHLFTRVEPGKSTVPAELVGTWRQTELREGTLETLTITADGHYGMTQQSGTEGKPRQLVPDSYIIRFWQAPTGPAVTRVMHMPDMGGPVLFMSQWKLDGKAFVLTPMVWDSQHSKLEVAPAEEAIRFERVKP